MLADRILKALNSRVLEMSLVLFIHGFLGSTDSFHSFPNDLMSMFPNASVKIYPTYDTKGNITKQIHALTDYLLLEANTSIYSSVILIGHSMGGILAVDAYNYLESLDALKMVNIIKIISVDSPFFGISSRDLSKSSISNVSLLISYCSTYCRSRSIAPSTTTSVRIYCMTWDR